MSHAESSRGGSDRGGSKFGRLGPDDEERFLREASRALDRTAIEDCAIPSLLLMEHASIGLAIECLRRLPPESGRVEISCGPGNNGGDGLACARHLRNAGVDVTILELLPPGGRRAGSDPAVHLEIARRTGIRIVDASDGPGPGAPTADLCVDAIFGTGLSRPADGVFATAIERLLASPTPVLAADIPSGLDADTGAPIGPTVEAAVTVTFGIPKAGFLAPGAERFTGDLRCVPIGVPRKFLPDGFPAFPPVPHRLEVRTEPTGQRCFAIRPVGGGTIE